MDKVYIQGRSNLATTIFVPYDCPNNCPFCTSKKDYKDTKDFSLRKILNSFKKTPHTKDVVITGGEPFADLASLQKIIDAVFKTSSSSVYINTTLPAATPEEGFKIANFLQKNRYKIVGLNISRHMRLKTKYEQDSLIGLIHQSILPLKIRINCVLNGTETKEDVKKFVDTYSKIADEISFRCDYRNIKTQDDLRTLDLPILNILFEDGFLYEDSGGCMVCNNDNFRDKKTFSFVTVHRGFEHSLVKKGKYYIVNDIIIKQDGKVYCDWDCNEDNLIDLNEFEWGEPWYINGLGGWFVPGMRFSEPSSSPCGSTYKKPSRKPSGNTCGSSGC